LIKNSYLLLASNSPRRAQILKKFGYTFTVTSHHFDEDSLDPNDFLSPRNYVRFLAKSKAHSIKRSSYNLILSADTIVVFNNIIFNKPTNRDQAFSFLSQLQGSTHQVISAFCLYDRLHCRTTIRSALSNVTFNTLTDSQLYNYIDTYQPFDKAGAYGIQECPSYFIASYTGSIYTIMGLPIYLLNKTIKDSH
tara:strand:+ start:2216 stop:2794 length:579 start_codon:yes stop_codon:yes gene_type:complete